MPKPRPPKFVTLAIMTTLTVIFWVFFSVYRVLTEKIEPSASAEILAPLNPTLNTEDLNEIGDRIYFDDSDIIDLPIEIESESQEASPTSASDAASLQTETETPDDLSDL